MSLSALRAALMDDRVHTVAGRTAVFDGEAEHFRTNDDGNVVVSCVTHNGEMPVWANLGPMAGAAGNGVWWIPDVGTEVMLASDGGDIEGEVYLVACFPTGAQAPSGLAPGKVLVIGSEVEVRSAAGTAVALATKQDLQNHVDTFNSHVHVETGGSTNAPTTPAGNPNGTSVLKAE